MARRDVALSPLPDFLGLIVGVGVCCRRGCGTPSNHPYFPSLEKPFSKLTRGYNGIFLCFPNVYWLRLHLSNERRKDLTRVYHTLNSTDTPLVVIIKVTRTTYLQLRMTDRCFSLYLPSLSSSFSSFKTVSFSSCVSNGNSSFSPHHTKYSPVCAMKEKIISTTKK